MYLLAEVLNTECKLFVELEKNHKHNGRIIPDPLKDLVAVPAACRPDVVILMAPSVDSRLTQDIKSFMSEMTFDDYFKSTSPHPQGLYNQLRDCITLCCTSEFPRKISFVLEPALLNINGVTIGLTSTDIVSHLCQREK